MKKIKITWSEAFGLVFPYIRSRITEQVRAISPILLYLAAFQIFVLGIPIIDAGIIASGAVMVVLGLAFFMEGLILGLMPLGEIIGLRLPEKSSLWVVMAFSMVLGIGATLAEPAIGALRILGCNVRAWDAPLLFLLLNRYPAYLVGSVGAGVGLAVAAGMLRFYLNCSLKPFICVVVPFLIFLSIRATCDSNLLHLVGLAWDCGAVTTGPVTVPLVLALGIGVTRIIGRSNNREAASGLGVVTLASLIPVMMVLLLGVMMAGNTPDPMTEEEFLSQARRQSAMKLFRDEASLTRYVFSKASLEGIDHFFGSTAKRHEFIAAMAVDSGERARIFGDDINLFRRWVALHGSTNEKTALFGSLDAAIEDLFEPAQYADKGLLKIAGASFLQACRAVIPLTLFMLLVLLVAIRQRLPRTDEVIFGIVLAVVGMSFFNIGMDAGLARLGNQAGRILPASFSSVPMEEQREIIRDFPLDAVQNAVTDTGQVEPFFFHRKGRSIRTVQFSGENYDPASGIYVHRPYIGPLFGGERGFAGILVALLFALCMGYAATLAEPALSALGLKVEEITVGTFRKKLLMQAVASGVGVGILFGAAKIFWDIPLVWLLVPPYIALVFLTLVSSDDFVDIAWDSAGVTTGPVTVPLVLALGLGIGTKTGVVEGFGILAMASVYPVLSVLLVGIHAAMRRKMLEDTTEAGLSGPGEVTDES